MIDEMTGFEEKDSDFVNPISIFFKKFDECCNSKK